MLPVRFSSKACAMALGSSATMPAKMIREIPLPIPRWVILLAQPHQEHGTAKQGHNSGQTEEPARINNSTGALKAHRKGKALNDSQQHCAVAGILVDLLAALFTFLFPAGPLMQTCWSAAA